MSKADPLSNLGRGVFALKSYEPCPRPGTRTSVGQSSGVAPDKVGTTPSRGELTPDSLSQSSRVTSTNSRESGPAAFSSRPQQPSGAASSAGSVGRPPSDHKPVAPKAAQQPSTSPAPNNGVEKELMAKYSYSANPNRPGGFDELSFKQRDRLWLIREHPTNEHWLEARHDNGQRGFVPASYMKVVEKAAATLPWLNGSSTKSDFPTSITEPPKEPSVFGAPPESDKQQSFKTYIPSYSKPTITSTQAEDQYYCEICDKQLNGPLPYRAHMTSKYHKEEVEARKLYN